MNPDTFCDGRFAAVIRVVTDVKICDENARHKSGWRDHHSVRCIVSTR